MQQQSKKLDQRELREIPNGWRWLRPWEQVAMVPKGEAERKEP